MKKISYVLVAMFALSTSAAFAATGEQAQGKDKKDDAQQSVLPIAPANGVGEVSMCPAGTVRQDPGRSAGGGQGGQGQQKGDTTSNQAQ